jgi:hypothetical protein
MLATGREPHEGSGPPTRKAIRCSSAGRERILAAFRGEEPDFIPFTPNIWQWFYYHQTHHSLPPPARMAGRNSNTFFPRSIRADGRSGGPLRWTVGEWRLILQPGRHIQNR